jgi:precorrin-6A/cobalt-precorrin-6A reductase
VRVLLLGGTAEARHLAALLADRPGFDVVTSLAGRTPLAGRYAAPIRPLPGRTRIGGFGGADGLTAWLDANDIQAVVDATHPFAQEISTSAVEATRRARVPLLVLRRPGWTEGPGDDWRRVPSLEAAAATLPGDRIFLTTGRTNLAAFARDDRRWFLIRSVDPPEPPLPPRSHVVLARGPFTVDGETRLMREHAIDVLVTKDSGGTMTAAKLVAARRLCLPVVLVDRPPLPSGARAVVSTAGEALAWLDPEAIPTRQ